jgi:phosphoserine phosphatase
MSFRITAQSPLVIPAAQISALLANTFGADLRETAPQVFQWISVTAPSLALRDAAAAINIDLNAIPTSWRWEHVGLLASDMDSTLITVECIDEIAQFAGLKTEVARITERAMRGELDFSQALRERVGMLKGLPKSVLQEVFEQKVRLSPGALDLVNAAHAIGAKSLLVSGGFTFFTHSLKAALDLHETHANVLGFGLDGALSGNVEGPIVDGAAKARAVVAAKRALAPGKLTIAMGDGANDLPMMEHADLSVAYRAKPAVRARATVALQHCGLFAVRRLFP